MIKVRKGANDYAANELHYSSGYIDKPKVRDGGVREHERKPRPILRSSIHPPPAVIAAMGSWNPQLPEPWIKTPCLRSASLSRIAGCNIFLKLDNLQPSGSFKSRGIGNLCLRAVASNPTANLHFYCSSGGNAGLACAAAAASVDRPATIVVPMATSAWMLDKLKELNARVFRYGENIGQADAYMRKFLLAGDPNGVYVSPYDHQDIWTGASSLIDELQEQLDCVGGFDAIICSVGGGGLLNGIMQGLQKYGLLECHPRVQVLATETKGADSLSQSLRAGRLVTLPKITSIATSLGISKVSAATFDWAQHPAVSSVVYSDEQAVKACLRFADDERMLVEPACGVSLAPLYTGDLRGLLGKGLDDKQWKDLNIVVEVCGGNNVTFASLQKYASISD